MTSENKIASPEELKEESVFSRWSRRKREAEQVPLTAESAEATEVNEIPPLTDDDMPLVESLQSDSNISPFMSSGVSDALKRKAFRKIFLSERFNVRDGLDDYDDDFTAFQPLGDVITAEYRRWRARYDEMQAKEEASPTSSDANLDFEDDTSDDVETIDVGEVDETTSETNESERTI
ncbi:DUF3306 domain-containing protein [Candidatus Persebacteraceae bacterium Df01]|jgi:hypothetical protein|uniref:DUF3306 domain-containing protein n=1 Tax=Candidatus Doriopsillibacter californiensis TaxID=2970740 RepID=A0ABT7QMN5_9GAMM|nr:DUF3306 domain-containing protein [Candidatus Persebacteraceae bacterium Df01]